MNENANSAIEEIFAIADKIQAMSERLEILDKNIKSLNNKFIILTKRIDSPSNVKKIKSGSTNTNNNDQEISSKLVLGAVKTYGYIVNEDRTPITGVSINIHDSSGSKIRNIKTDKDGYWEARLPSDKYQVIYTHSKFKDLVKNITLEKGIKSYEVI